MGGPRTRRQFRDRERRADRGPGRRQSHRGRCLPQSASYSRTCATISTIGWPTCSPTGSASTATPSIGAGTLSSPSSTSAAQTYWRRRSEIAACHRLHATRASTSPHRVLSAGPAPQRALAALRISLGRWTTAIEIDEAAQQIAAVVPHRSQHSPTNHQHSAPANDHVSDRSRAVAWLSAQWPSMTCRFRQRPQSAASTLRMYETHPRPASIVGHAEQPGSLDTERGAVGDDQAATASMYRCR